MSFAVWSTNKSLAWLDQFCRASMRLVLSSFLLMALAASSGPIFAQTTNNFAPLDAAISAPKSLLDLMRNIKAAIDSSLILRRDFYSEGNLLRLFGGEKVLWSGDAVDPLHVSGYVYEFSRLGAQTKTPSGAPLDTLTLAFRREMSLTGLIEAEILIHLPGEDANRPSFDDIEDIFGKAWLLDNEQVWPAHKLYKAPTAAHGNDRIVYRSDKPNLTVIAAFEFAFDGRVRVATFVVKGREQ